MEDKTIKKEIDLGNGYSFLIFDDGTAAIVKRASEVTEDMVEEILAALGGKKEEKPKPKEEKPGKKTKDDPEPEPDGYTWGDLKEMDEDELIALIKENELDTDPDDYEDNEAGLRKAIAKEIGVEVPKKK